MGILDKIKGYLVDNYGKIPEQDLREVKPEVLEPAQIVRAKRWHGKHEVRDKALLKSFLGFDPSTTAWCAGFVNAIEKECGRKGTGKLSARSYLTYGTATDNPRLGDIVVFKRGKLPWQGHVGYYVSKDNNGVLVLGGNQSDKVCYKYYPTNSVLGYRRPG